MCRTLLTCSLIIFLMAWRAPIHAADFREEIQAAMEEISPIRKELGQLMVQGRLDEANTRLLAVFPEKKRTPAQSQVLGNMLYSIDPKLSYGLHHDAAKHLPNETQVQLEWAMEQHRAGEYKGALAAYDVFSKAFPDYAPVHGVAADCLIRLGRTAEAITRWGRSEAAKNGTLENFETMVYEIYGDHSANVRRATLRSQATKGDVDAAVKLIVLDSDYPHDWWNGGVHGSYLTADLPVLDGLPADKRIAALKCLGACKAMEGDEDAKEPEHRKPFVLHGLILDDQHTLAPDPAVSALLIANALQHKLMTTDAAKGWFANALIAQAHHSKDATLWNLVAFLLEEDDRLLAIEQEAWKSTGDVRFAVGYLLEHQKHGGLKADDPDLVAAATQFPESAELAHLLITCTQEPDAKLLIRGITSEYRHFSSLNPAGFIHRPGAWALRSYFTALGKLKP